MFSLPRVSRKTIFVLLFLGIIQVSCTNHSSPAQSFAERACIDSLVRANRNLDSMEIWLEKFSREQNHIGLIFVCRELGKRYREKSRFSEALAIHNRGLRLAIELADTLDIADAYNNIGTDLRRMGMLSEAADSHYLALHIAEQYTGNEPRQNRKNYVYALNGLGNIYKALDNRNEAEHYFRRALKIETEMGNELGQAINWANLGSIYKYRQQYDSAYLCFTRSLEHNERARSKLGIALCHTHFGQIHECRGDYEQAFGEYNISYRLLKAIPDKWNLLKSCTALASLHFRRGNLPKAKKILDEALISAREIHSFGHLEELHLLRSEYYERLGICRNALHELKLSHQYRDSLLTDQNESMVYETQIRYERDKKAREIAELNEQNERQIRSRRQVTITSGIVILLTVHDTRSSGLRPAHEDPFTTDHTAYGRHAAKFFHEHHARIPHTVNCHPRPGRTSDGSKQRQGLQQGYAGHHQAKQHLAGTDQPTVGYRQNTFRHNYPGVAYG